MIPKKILIDASKINPDVKIDLYDIDLTMIVGNKMIYRFHNGLNELRKPITWQGNVYSPCPIQGRGFEKNGQGTSNRPTLSIFNGGGLLNEQIDQCDDMLGAIVTRREVLAKHLDVVNFENGNSDADHYCEIVSNYVIEQLKQQDSAWLTFELALPCESDGALIPARIITANTCSSIYRSSECGYTGGAVADEFDNPTSDITKDKCSRCLNGCRLRFGKHGNLPFSGFPTAAKLS